MRLIRSGLYLSKLPIKYPLNQIQFLLNRLNSNKSESHNNELNSQSMSNLRKFANFPHRKQSSQKGLIFNLNLASTHPLKKRFDKESTGDGFLNISGYGLAQFIDLKSLHAHLSKESTYHFPILPNELITEVLLVCSKDSEIYTEKHWDAFIFSNGVTVFWNMSDSLHNHFIKDVRCFAENPVEPRSVEREDLRFCFTNDKTCLIGEDIFLKTVEDSNLVKQQTNCDYSTQNSILLEKFAFSDALALSVKLSLLEYGFDMAAEEIEPWIEYMKIGVGYKFRQSAVLRKTGELFTLKHLLNVSTTLIETPDFYWERPEVERLFIQLKSALNVSGRTKILNSRLDMCCGLTEIISNHLRSKHASRLEWMIIVLIMIEIIFEAFYYYERNEERITFNNEPVAD